MQLNNKKICIAGANGFLGKHLTNLLNRKEFEIVSASHSNYDLRKRKEVVKLFDEKDFDILVHLAANVGGIEYNRKHPADLFYDNAMMAMNLIRQSRMNNIDKFVGVGSVCAYPRDTEVPFSEDDLWNGYPEETNAPYGMAKKVMLEYGKACQKQYDFNAIHLMPVNMYGPHDDFDLESAHVIPALIKKFVDARDSNKKEVTVWGTGKPTREFLYAEDCARSIVQAVENCETSDPVNIGSGEEISIAELAELIREIVGFDGELVWDTSKPDGQPRRCLDTTKAKEEFGFEASTPLRRGLEETIEWYESKN